MALTPAEVEDRAREQFIKELRVWVQGQPYYARVMARPRSEHRRVGRVIANELFKIPTIGGGR